jgi:hypothetical protein
VADRGDSTVRRLLRPRALLAVRLGWLALPVVTGAAVEAALTDASSPVRWVAGVGLWAAWALGLVALLVPRPASLTAIRVLAPAGVPLALWAWLAGDPTPVTLAWTTALAVAVFFPTIGEHFVDGVSYGDERRFPLRPPVLLLAGPIPLTWAAVVAGVVAGPLLLATGRWVLGAVALVVGLVITGLGLRALHGLARRWVVLVPAGLVVHDAMSTLDPFLCRRVSIASLAPADIGTDLQTDATLDATQGAAGIVVDLRMADDLSVVPVRGRSRAQAPRTVSRVLLCPSRPGALLHEASLRRLVPG